MKEKNENRNFREIFVSKKFKRLKKIDLKKQKNSRIFILFFA